MKHTNKQIIDLSTSYDGIEHQYQLENRINHFMERFNNVEIIKIEINNVEILPNLQQLKQVLLSMSKNQLIKSKVFIESGLSKNDIETLNLLAKIFNRKELEVA